MKSDKRLLKKIDGLMCGDQDIHWKAFIASDLDCLLVEAEAAISENPVSTYARKLTKAIIRIVERVKNFEDIK